MPPFFPEPREGDASWGLECPRVAYIKQNPRTKYGAFGRRISHVMGDRQMTTATGAKISTHFWFLEYGIPKQATFNPKQIGLIPTIGMHSSWSEEQMYK